MVDNTIALLDEAELAVFQRLSVIGGPADLALIQATVADEHVPAGRVVRILAQLAERALVRLDRTAVRWIYDQHPVLRRAGRGALTPADVRQINERWPPLCLLASGPYMVTVSDQSDATLTASVSVDIPPCEPEVPPIEPVPPLAAPRR